MDENSDSKKSDKQKKIDEKQIDNEIQLKNNHFIQAVTMACIDITKNSITRESIKKEEEKNVSKSIPLNDTGTCKFCIILFIL